jgi:transglutaminase-like putative cysteine protease
VSRISTHCELRYTVHTPSAFFFIVLPARGARQEVVEEKLAVHPAHQLRRESTGPGTHELVRVLAEPGPLVLRHDAIVAVNAYVPETAPTTEVHFADLPVDVIPFLQPSRFCPSDLLTRTAAKAFGDLAPGFERITGICNWVYDRLDYVAGSTGPSTTATDVLVQGAGVCRDYAHVGIALCRALGVPARYVSGYAVDLDPPDFHGFFEAYLDGDWYLFDATRMAPVDGLVRIAVGRDAADVAFASFVGAATLDGMVVSTIDLDRTNPDDGTMTAAISTA